MADYSHYTELNFRNKSDILDRTGPAFPLLRVSDVSNVSGVSGVSFVSDVSRKHRYPAQKRNTRAVGRLPYKCAPAYGQFKIIAIVEIFVTNGAGTLLSPTPVPPA
ncbi:MAG: hypothetical protein ACRD6X_08705 [Pyrinomonadaceae bacterium]